MFFKKKKQLCVYFFVGKIWLSLILLSVEPISFGGPLNGILRYAKQENNLLKNSSNGPKNHHVM